MSQTGRALLKEPFTVKGKITQRRTTRYKYISVEHRTLLEFLGETPRSPLLPQQRLLAAPAPPEEQRQLGGAEQPPSGSHNRGSQHRLIIQFKVPTTYFAVLDSRLPLAPTDRGHCTPHFPGYDFCTGEQSGVFILWILDMKIQPKILEGLQAFNSQLANKF